MKSYSLFVGDSYSKEIADFLKSFFNFNESSNSQILFPFSINRFDSKKENILVLDHGHFYFENIKKILSLDWDLVISAKDIDTSCPVKKLSLYENLVHSKVNVQEQFREEFIYCSQPLKEDGRLSCPNQYEFESFLKDIFKNFFPGKKLLVKAHPRELRKGDLEKGIIESLSSFDKWIGHSSMPLYGAKSLGHHVFFLERYDLFSDEMKRDLISFIKTQKKLTSSFEKFELSELLI